MTRSRSTAGFTVSRIARTLNPVSVDVGHYDEVQYSFTPPPPPLKLLQSRDQ